MIRTRIIATVGPSVSSIEAIEALVEAGAGIFRFNMSHGDVATREKWLEWIREIGARRNVALAVLADLCGPRIRVKKFADGGAELKVGQTFSLTSEDVPGDSSRVSIAPTEIIRDIRVGDRVLLDDGRIELKVVSKNATTAETRVIEGGVLKDNKGLNLPGTPLSLPACTNKDRQDLAWALSRDIDFVAISFVRTASDVAEVKRIIAAAGHTTPVIVKIEKPEAIENLDAILRISNGVMVARGDLGVEVGVEKVPLFQKRIIDAANRCGVTVITATQMLDSMIFSPYPTRAEASDVANAVLDGTDAVMLSGETAAGKYPVESVRMMARIIAEAETRLAETAHHAVDAIECDVPFVGILGRAARNTAATVGARHLAVFSESGRSVRVVSKYHPPQQILGLTPAPASWRRMAMYWGVIPILVPRSETGEIMMGRLEEFLLAANQVVANDMVVALFSTSPGHSGSTNSLRLIKVGEVPTPWRYRTEA